MTDFELMRDGGMARVALGVNLTAQEVPELQSALKNELASGIEEVVFELSRTKSVDSTGIGLLIAANNSLSAINGRIRLINVSSDILKLLQSMRLAERLHATAALGETSHG